MRLFHKNLDLGLLLESQIWQFWAWTAHGKYLLRESSNSPWRCFLISHSSHGTRAEVRLEGPQWASVRLSSWSQCVRSLRKEQFWISYACSRCLSRSRHFINKYLLNSPEHSRFLSHHFRNEQNFWNSEHTHTISYNHTIYTMLIFSIINPFGKTVSLLA